LLNDLVHPYPFFLIVSIVI